MPKNGLGDMLWITDLSLVRSPTTQSDVIPTFPRLLITLPAPTAYPAHLCPQFCYKNKSFVRVKQNEYFLYYGKYTQSIVGFTQPLVEKLREYLPTLMLRIRETWSLSVRRRALCISMKCYYALSSKLS